jgi:hypothetical protein
MQKCNHGSDDAQVTDRKSRKKCIRKQHPADRHLETLSSATMSVIFKETKSFSLCNNLVVSVSSGNNAVSAKQRDQRRLVLSLSSLSTNEELGREICIMSPRRHFKPPLAPPRCTSPCSMASATKVHISTARSIKQSAPQETGHRHSSTQLRSQQAMLAQARHAAQEAAWFAGHETESQQDHHGRAVCAPRSRSANKAARRLRLRPLVLA